MNSAFILTSTASSRQAPFARTATAGSAEAPDSFSPSKCWEPSFAARSSLRKARAAGDLHLGDDTANRRFHTTIDKLYRTSWVVYAKRPFGGAEQVLRYLGRYTHRVGISNQRLSHIDDGSVTFRTKNGRSTTLSSDEFLRRFLDHVLPRRFVKIRHYGLLAPAHATTTLDRARAALDAQHQRHESCANPPSPATRSELAESVDWRDLLRMLTGIDITRCSQCGSQRIDRRPVAPHCPRAPPWTA